jgi:sec-independent protein translocase protein TatA
MFAGYYEIIIVAAIAMLLFGKRVPGVMRSLGESIVEFKRGIKSDGEGSRESGTK